MASLGDIFQPCGFDELPGWREDDHAQAFAAFRRSALHVLTKPYRTGSLGVDHAAFSSAFAAARAAGGISAIGARRFFESHFAACRIVAGKEEAGFVTGFYEPVAEASQVRTGPYRHPLYRRPADLVDVDDENRPSGLDPYFAFARRARDGSLVEYFDRAAIEKGALEGRGLEIAWLADPVELFFIHVQGAARLRFPDRSVHRVTYAAKSGHPFTGPGGVLASLGEIPLRDVTMQSIKAWFACNPERIDEILWQNRSFIFFREAPVDDVKLGPVAAAKVPLTPGRSLAVDRMLHTFATPFYIHAPELTVFDGKPFARLMIAQDTGSAIIGPARGDLFVGSGEAAGEIAGVIRHRADFFALLPRLLVSERR